MAQAVSAQFFLTGIKLSGEQARALRVDMSTVAEQTIRPNHQHRIHHLKVRVMIDEGAKMGAKSFRRFRLASIHGWTD